MLDNVTNSDVQHLTYYCDEGRHLICVPYTVKNLHRMAKELNLHICWYHAASNFPHYDIPKRRVEEIKSKSTVIEAKDLVRLIKDQITILGDLTGIQRKSVVKENLARVNTPLGHKIKKQRKYKRAVP